MDVDDPFASIAKLCHVSNSQEDHLRRCRFAGESEEKGEEVSEDSGEIPVESTGIMMVSLPESSGDNHDNDSNTPKDNDIFQTPPEGSPIASTGVHRDDCTVVAEEETAGGCTEGEKVVDLGADTDLGFSDVDLTQRFDSANEVIYPESNNITVLKRELAVDESLSESQLKKSKISDENLCPQSPNQCLGEGIKSMMETVEKSKSDKEGSYDRGYESPQNNKNSDASGESSAKRRLEFICEVLESETVISHSGLGPSDGLEHNIRNRDGSECNSGDGKRSSNSGQKCIEDINKFRFVGPSNRHLIELQRTRGIRALPISIRAPGEKDTGKELDLQNDCEEITLLDVLRMLARNCDYDGSLDSKSILDVAKSRGMTFP